jgi:hypothetical protein
VRVEGEASELAALLFPAGLIPQILSLIVDVWKTFTRPATTEDEPKITNRFVKEMQKEKRRRGHKFTIKSHVKELENLDEATGRGFGEIDVLVQHGYDERCYFGIEAKKLNSTTKTGNWDSGSGDYVGEPGMGCFVDGRYSYYQPHGGMIGYVMDGDCLGAKVAIAGSMQRKIDYLKMSASCKLEPSRHFPDRPDIFETRHHLERGEFKIFHVLLAA